ncbi:MAG: hypothetical protein WKG06_12490 [Segetibacter sp.]
MNPAFVMAASQLLGDKPVRFWHDQIFYKPAKKGGVVGLAPGLLLLDKNKACSTHHMLVRSRRCNY